MSKFAALVVAALLGSAAFVSADSSTGVGKLTGTWLDRPVSVTFREADLGRTLDTVGKLAGVSFQVAADLHYKVSFEMHDVPTRRALEVIGESQSLVYRQECQTIIVQRADAVK